jgi:hypothetical protein
MNYCFLTGFSTKPIFFYTHSTIPLSIHPPIQSQFTDDQRNPSSVPQGHSLVLKPSFFGLPRHMFTCESARIALSPWAITPSGSQNPRQFWARWGFVIQPHSAHPGGSITRNATLAFVRRADTSNASNTPGPPTILAGSLSNPSFWGKGSIPRFALFEARAFAVHYFSGSGRWIQSSLALRLILHSLALALHPTPSTYNNIGLNA